MMMEFLAGSGIALLVGYALMGAYRKNHSSR